MFISFNYEKRYFFRELILLRGTGLKWKSMESLSPTLFWCSILPLISKELPPYALLNPPSEILGPWFLSAELYPYNIRFFLSELLHHISEKKVKLLTDDYIVGKCGFMTFQWKFARKRTQNSSFINNRIGFVYLTFDSFNLLRF